MLDQLGDLQEMSWRQLGALLLGPYQKSPNLISSEEKKKKKENNASFLSL